MTEVLGNLERKKALKKLVKQLEELVLEAPQDLLQKMRRLRGYVRDYQDKYHARMCQCKLRPQPFPLRIERWIFPFEEFSKSSVASWSPP